MRQTKEEMRRQFAMSVQAAEWSGDAAGKSTSERVKELEDKLDALISMLGKNDEVETILKLKE